MSKPTKPINDVIHRFRQLNPDNLGTVVAVSGGVDSVALAFCLSKVCDDLCLAHITHRGIRDDATLEAETELVRKLAERLGAKFRLYEFEVDKDGNLEGNARYQRYQALTRLCYGEGPLDLGNPEYRLLATAHHADDQLETIIMNLARGSSVAGMSGIGELMQIPYSDDVRLMAIRPMLGITKEDCYEICRENDLEWLEDATNQDTELNRNLVRHEILPLMRKLNPKAAQHASNMAAIMHSVQQLLDKTVISLPDSGMWGNIAQSVSADALRLEPDIVIYEWLRSACMSVPRSGGVDIDKINKRMLDEVVQAVRNRRSVSFEWPLRTVEVSPESVVVKKRT